MPSTPDYTPAEIAAIQAYEAHDDALRAFNERSLHDRLYGPYDVPKFEPDREVWRSVLAKGYDIARGRPRRLITDDWD